MCGISGHNQGPPRVPFTENSTLGQSQLLVGSYFMFIVSDLVLKRREAYIECVPSTGLPHLICCLIKSLKSFLILQRKKKRGPGGLVTYPVVQWWLWDLNLGWSESDAEASFTTPCCFLQKLRSLPKCRITGKLWYWVSALSPTTI